MAKEGPSIEEIAKQVAKRGEPASVKVRTQELNERLFSQMEGVRQSLGIPGFVDGVFRDWDKMGAVWRIRSGEVGLDRRGTLSINTGVHFPYQDVFKDYDPENPERVREYIKVDRETSFAMGLTYNPQGDSYVLRVDDVYVDGISPTTRRPEIVSHSGIPISFFGHDIQNEQKKAQIQAQIKEQKTALEAERAQKGRTPKEIDADAKRHFKEIPMKAYLRRKVKLEQKRPGYNKFR